MAGIIFKTKFIESGNKKFQEYINYIDRDEAVRIEMDDKYNLFNDYMGNPEKSTGLFTVDKDELTEEEKQELKDIFSKAQDKGSLLFQSIFSFESEWLKKYGLLDENDILNEKLLMQYTRSAVSKLFKEENMESFQWSAAIHYNTKHYHIHIAYVDPEPCWEEGKGRCYRDRNGELKQRGKFKQSSIDKTKSTFVNNAIDSRKTNEYINNIIRDKIILGKKEHAMIDDIKLRNEFVNLLETLPNDMRKWNYKNNAMKPYREQIDLLSKRFIDLYFEKEFQEIQDLIDDISKDYKMAYGGQKEADEFAKNKIEDLYYRMGNSILSECRNVEKKRREQVTDILNKKYYKSQAYKSIGHLNIALNHDIKHIKNQLEYKRLQRELEYEQSKPYQ